jgi:uncharacterized protein (DUF58 family)
MDVATLIRKVRKVEIKTRGLSQHLFSGGYHSAFKGRGMSFSEVRQYHFGDDVRNIDWNVTARTGDPYIKIFEEERELTVMLIVDVSGSAFFGSGEQQKQELLTELCAVLAISAESNNDKVGLILFSDKIELYLPPNKGRQHSLRLIRELLQVQPSSRSTNTAHALQFARNVLKKRGVCFLMSDFIDQGYEAPLKVMARRHDLIGIQCWDLLERELPNIGLLRTVSAERGELRWIDSTDPDYRRAYRHRFEENMERSKQLFQLSGADWLSLQTGQPYAKALMRLFAERAAVRHIK